MYLRSGGYAIPPKYLILYCSFGQHAHEPDKVIYSSYYLLIASRATLPTAWSAQYIITFVTEMFSGQCS